MGAERAAYLASRNAVDCLLFLCELWTAGYEEAGVQVFLEPSVRSLRETNAASSPVSPGPHQELRQSDSIIKEIKADDGGGHNGGVSLHR